MADEKKRLKRIAAAVLPKNFGVIIRTAAMEAKDEDIEHDIQSQIDRWRKTCAAIKKSTPPAQLMSEMNRANTIIRDSLNGSFSQIAVDDEAMYNDIRNYIRLIEPEKEKIVTLEGVYQNIDDKRIKPKQREHLLEDKPTKLSEVAEISDSESMNSITRSDQKRYIKVSGTLKDGYTNTDVSNTHPRRNQ